MFRSLAVLAYPIAGDTAERPLLAVWIALALASIVPVLPLLPVVGYLTRVLVASERGDSLPAFFDDARTLLRRSLGGTLLVVLFIGIPLAALLVTVYGILSIDSGSDVPTVRFLAGSTAVLFIGLFGLYLLPVSLTSYGREGSLRESLSLTTLRRIGGHGAYFFGWATGCVVLSFAAAIGTTLYSVSRLGPFLAAFVFGYGLLVTTHLWGHAVGRARRFA